MNISSIFKIQTNSIFDITILVEYIDINHFIQTKISLWWQYLKLNYLQFDNAYKNYIDWNHGTSAVSQ